MANKFLFAFMAFSLLIAVVVSAAFDTEDDDDEFNVLDFLVAAKRGDIDDQVFEYIMEKRGGKGMGKKGKNKYTRK